MVLQRVRSQVQDHDRGDSGGHREGGGRENLYCRAEFPDQAIMDTKFMAIGEKYRAAKTPKELYDSLLELRAGVCLRVSANPYKTQ